MIKAKLILEEKREQLDKRQEETEAKAFMSKIKENAQGKRMMYGRYEEGRRDAKERRDNRGEERRNILCFACGDEGHISRFCPRFNKNTSTRGRSRQQNDNNPKDTPKAARTANASTEEDRTTEESLSARSVKFKALQVKTTPDRKKDEQKFLWICDSGATHHMTPFKDILNDFDGTLHGEVELADGECARVEGKGSVTLKISEECGGWTIQLNEVIYVPELENNLISLVQLDKKGLEMKIKNGSISIKDDKEVLFKAVSNGGDVYMVKCDAYDRNGQIMKNSNWEESEQIVTRMIARKTAFLWHQRLGHMSKLPEVCKTGNIFENCETCIKAKMKRRKFDVSENKTKDVLQLVHSDIVGKITPQSIGGAQYFVTFLDDYSRYSEVAVIKRKDEVFEKLTTYVQKSELQQEKQLKALQTDNGGEYKNDVVRNYLNNKGVIHRLTVPRTPQQNGRAERLNQTLLNVIRCLLLHSGLPNGFWAEALFAANYIRNRCPSTAIDMQVPYELWFRQKLTDECVRAIKVFGC